MRIKKTALGSPRTPPAPVLRGLNARPGCHGVRHLLNKYIWLMWPTMTKNGLNGLKFYKNMALACFYWLKNKIMLFGHFALVASIFIPKKGKTALFTYNAIYSNMFSRSIPKFWHYFFCFNKWNYLMFLAKVLNVCYLGSTDEFLAIYILLFL